MERGKKGEEESINGAQVGTAAGRIKKTSVRKLRIEEERSVMKGPKA